MNELTLPNGLRIVHQTADNAVGYCGFMVDCGSRDEESQDIFGMAHFIEHILFKGTKKRNSWHINERMESVGGELNAFTTKEETTFYADFLNHDFERACELLCDLICNPTAPQNELENEQDVVIEEIESYLDNPSELIYDEFENRIFAGLPLGHNILGSKDTVKSFDSKKCLSFIDTHYTPDRMIFFSYGTTPFNKVINTVEKYFNTDRCAVNKAVSTLGNDSAEKLSTDVNNYGQDINTPEVINHSTHQSHVIIGARSYAIGNPKSAALSLINNILGGPGMNTRLNRELREKRGLVYSVESSINNYTDSGYLSIYFGCDHKDVNKCISICETQLARLCEKAFTPRQLEAAKKQLKGQLGVATANLENNAIGLAKKLLRTGHVETLAETCQRIDDVSIAQIQEVANEVFDKNRMKSLLIK